MRKESGSTKPRTTDAARTPRSSTASFARTRSLALGLTSLFLMACLTSCATQQEAPLPQVVRIQIPSDLTDPLPLPPLDGTTNRALVEWVFEGVALIERANADRAAVRALSEPSRDDPMVWD